MDMNNFQDLINNIRSLVRCPKCHHGYDNNGISVINEVDGAYIVYLECHFCGSSGLATVVAKDISNGQDINNKIIKRNDNISISNPSKINVDDIIDFHQFLDDFDGDFESCIK